MESVPTFANLKTSLQNNVFEVMLNRPQRFNALSHETYLEVVEAMKWADVTAEVRVVLVSGAGDYFSSGNDLSNFKQFNAENLEQSLESGKDTLRRFTRAFMQCRKPLVAAVNGPCIGIACTILGHFDFVYAAPGATFETPFMRLAQSPEGGSSLLMPLAMGRLQANRVLLLGDKLTAAEAQQRGWVTEVFPETGDAFRERVRGVARRLAGFAPGAVQSSRLLLKEVWAQRLREADEREVQLLGQRWASEECLNAVVEFMMRKKKSNL